VLISGFLGLMVDGMDFMFLASSLPKLTKDLRLSDLQAGSLGSYSLLGMAIGGARLNFAPSVLPMPQAVAV